MNDLGEWLALAIGNSRLHWAWFRQSRWQAIWHTPHLSQGAIACLIQSQFNFNSLHPWLPADTRLPHLGGLPPLWIASVVPAQASHWQSYPSRQFISLADIPLKNGYATLGLDRALTLWGAIHQWGSPVLVIDAGTALTVTAATPGMRLAGGAILPGVQVQLRSLAQNTANLPALSLPSGLPDRWAMTTTEAMYSGVIYSILAGMQDFIVAWLEEYPNSAIALTGGDSALFLPRLQARFSHLYHAPHLIFEGMQSIRDRGQP